MKEVNHISTTSIDFDVKCEKYRCCPICLCHYIDSVFLVQIAQHLQLDGARNFNLDTSKMRGIVIIG